MNSKVLATPKTEIDSRIGQLQRALQNKGIDGALIVQNTDLYYFTGTAQQGWLYVPAEGAALFMVFKEFPRAREESPLEQLVSLVSPKKIPETLADFGLAMPGVLGMELDVLPANNYFQYGSIFSGSEITDVSLDIRLIRAVKSPFEIDIVRKACAYADQVAAFVPEVLRAGKTEVELAGEVEAFARKQGHQGIIRMRMFGAELFYGHLLCGAAGGVPSYLASPTGGEGVSRLISQGAGFNRIVENKPVLVDYAFGYNGYIADHTRIFAIGGLPAELIAAHEAMLEIQAEVVRQAKSGVVSGEIYELSVELAEKKGLSDHFMGAGERKIRFSGHGVGLELDEFPFLAKGQTLALESGMVIAFEPKAIFPGVGVVGIENTHLVTDNGLETLTTFADNICII